MKKVYILFSLLLLFALAATPKLTLAEDSEDSMMETMMEDDDSMMEEDADEMTEHMEEMEEVMTEVNSYELFWPVTAGRTRSDSLYFLKILKEKFRGLLIFGDVKDADYQALIATKRAVEAEKLFMDGDSENAVKTLDDAQEAVEELREEMEDVDDRENAKAQIDEINNKLGNLEKFLPYLANTYTGSAEEINRTLDTVKEVNESI